MTRNASRTAIPRPHLVLTATLLVTGVAIGLVGTMRAPEASAVMAEPTCVTDDLTGTVIGQPRTPNSAVRDAVLQLTNTSGRACQVRGWADIAMVTPPGELVRVPTQKLDQTGAPITLEPEASAWSRLQWDTCEAGREGCQVGVAFQYITDPDSTGTVAEMTAVPEADDAGITMKALRVGPLQPTRTAAVV
jgi:hypothetical protein